MQPPLDDVAISHFVFAVAVLLRNFLLDERRNPENRIQQIEHARRVQRSGTRMRRLISDLVDVEAGVLAVTRAVGDPTDVVAEAVETFQAKASGSGISLTAEIMPGAPSIPFDARGSFRCSAIF